ncbi:MAG TPA: glycosyltransferase family 2 protein [Methylomirabilota bacterium]|nr:glycosyltransferase family 2 protein [Methylomirabilota bacterium]
MSEGAPELSVLLPAFNEAESLPVLWAELGPILDALARSAEVIFVDDGSADATPDVVRGFRAADPRVRLVRLAANAGLSAALDAGFRRARGHIVVTMDSDLQNDPHDIPRMLAALPGYDAVTGWRQQRDDPWLKRVSSRVANRVRNAITGEDVHDSACTLRVIRSGCLPRLPRFRGFHRFVPTLLRLAGCRVLELPVGHRARRFGASHYGIRNRALVAFEDLLAVRWMQSRWLRYEATEDP